MPAIAKIFRSTTPGATPPSLQSGQIAINEADGVLFYRSPSGAVTPLSTTGLAVYQTTAAFPAIGSGAVIYLASATSRLYRWVVADSVYAEVGTIGGIADSMDGGSYA